MNNIASVKTIRQNITIIQAHPGIYRWWFPVNKAKKSSGNLVADTISMNCCISTLMETIMLPSTSVKLGERDS